MSSIASHIEPDRCPYCDSLISRTRFIEVKKKIAEEERRNLAEERARMKRELQVREATIRKEASAEAAARAKTERENALAHLHAERERNLSKIKQLEESNLRHQQEIEKAKATTSKEASRQLEMAREQHRKDLEQTRAALIKDRDSQLRKEQAQRNREKEQLQKTIDGLTRQVQRKTSDELGDGAEVDVYESLHEAFPHDQITRVKRGMPGADVRHEVVHKGAACGTIIIDSKNRQSWQKGYVTKLREDQVAAKAEHAVLATSVFPRETKELCIDEATQVIIVNPARVVEIVALLRASLVRAHLLGLSLEQRAEKRDLLYKYLTSDEYRQRVEEADQLTRQLLDLDVEENRIHDRTWEKRGKMTTRLRNVVREIDTEVSAIVEDREQPASAGSRGTSKP